MVETVRVVCRNYGMGDRSCSNASDAVTLDGQPARKPRAKGGTPLCGACTTPWMPLTSNEVDTMRRCSGWVPGKSKKVKLSGV